MNLYSMLSKTISEYKKRYAVNYNFFRYTYEQLEDIIRKKCISYNLPQNSTIVVHGKNSFHMIATIYACLYKKTVIVPISNECEESVLVSILNETKPYAIIADNDLIGKYNEVYKKYCVTIYDIYSCTHVFNGKKLYEELDGEKYAFIIYSSGSTGSLKGVLCTHAAIRFAISRINACLKNNMTDSILCTSKFSFDYGLYQIFLAGEVGAEIVINDNTKTILSIPHIIRVCNVTGWAAVPSMLEVLMRSKSICKMNNLKYISSTGDILKDSIMEFWMHSLPYTEIFSMYGLTECKRVSIITRKEYLKHRGSVGKALPGTFVKLRKEDILQNEGELIVYGNHLMDGYFKDEALTKTTFWYDIECNCRALSTGDIFSIDQEGYLYFVSRTQQFVKRNEEKISLILVEKEILKLGIVSNVLAVSIREHGYEKIFLFVQGIDKSEEINLKNRIKEMLQRKYWPDYVVAFSGNFYLNKNGKLDRNRMKRIAEKYVKEVLENQ